MSDTSTEVPKELTETWTKKQRRVLDIFAVLGLVNLLAYLITQSSYVMQNLYWVYGIVTVIDIASFLIGLAAWDEYANHHFKKAIPKRFRNFIIATGLWILTVPIVVVGYYFPQISESLGTILFYTWGVSIAFGAAYDVAYLGVVIACWLSDGMEWS